MKELSLKFNPFKTDNEKLVLLNKIERKLMKLIDEFSEKESLSVDDIEELKSTIEKAITDRKIEYFFKSSSEGFAKHLQNITCLLLNTDTTTENPYKNKDLFYVKNTRHTVTYE